MDHKRKVLYIDDENPNLMLFEITFRNDFDVITASSARDGLQLLEVNEDIHVVISDMRMPEMNGLEFVAEAKKNRKDLKYCLLTGYDRTEEIDIAVKTQLIDQCLKKPFKREEILKIVGV